MSEKIKLKPEFIKKFREEGGNKKAELKEETKKEIDQHLNYVWEKLHWDYVYRQRENKSLEGIEKIEKKQKEDENLLQNAKKQLDAGEAGEEILHIILDFDTPEEKEANDNLYRVKKLLKRQGLDPDNLPPDHPSKRMIDSYEEQIKNGQDKRRGWAEYIKKEWGKKR